MHCDAMMLFGWILLGLLSGMESSHLIAAPPNVLFIAIDDQNDWIGCLKGHPFAQTPNIDHLARRGTLFSNAHCQAPLCNPSRTSVLLGLRPSTTGIYGLSPWFRQVESLKDRTTLLEYFQSNGYRTLTAGKIFHGPPGNADRNQESEIWGPGSAIGAIPPKKLIPPTPMGNHPLMDWGAFPHRQEDKGDYQLATWTIDRLNSMPRDRPFFLSVGFFLPHVPCYVTPEQLSAVPDDEKLLPEILENDRNDTPRFSWYLHWELPEPRLQWVRENRQWLPLVRSYIASTSFVDAQIGRILDALRSTGHDEDTIVVLWSDHGYHLGEKQITGKNTLWERSTHVPLIFAGPGIAGGATCSEPTELLDIYPSLIDLCKLPPRNDLEGHSLLPQLKDASIPTERPAITTHNQGNHSVRTNRWRLIRYADGSKELYDLTVDPKEWTNIATDPSHARTVKLLESYMPQSSAAPAPGSAQRILTYDSATDRANWEGVEIDRGSRIPE